MVEMCIKILTKEVGQKHDKRLHYLKLQKPTPSQQELNLSVLKTRSAETKPHQSDCFITLCQVQPPQHMPSYTPAPRQQQLCPKCGSTPKISLYEALIYNNTQTAHQNSRALLQGCMEFLKWAQEKLMLWFITQQRVWKWSWRENDCRIADYGNYCKIQSFYINSEISWSFSHKAVISMNRTVAWEKSLIIWGQRILQSKERRERHVDTQKMFDKLKKKQKNSNISPGWWKNSFFN